MLRTFFSAVVIFACSASFALADPKDDISAAIQKLKDAGSYTWTATIDSQGGFSMTGTTQGQIQSDGTLSVTNNFTFGDNTRTMQFIKKGDAFAVKTEDGWQSPDDLANAGGGGRFRGGMMRNFQAPASQMLDLVDKLQNIQIADGVYTADLNDDGAKQALMFGGRRRNADGGGPDISNAKASIKIWITDGALTKTVLHATGTVSFNGNDNDVDRTTTTEFKNIGSTTVDIPPEAAAKMAAPSSQPAPAPQQ